MRLYTRRAIRDIEAAACALGYADAQTELRTEVDPVIGGMGARNARLCAQNDLLVRDLRRYKLAWESARRRATWAHNEAATARSKRAVYKDLADTLTEKLSLARARVRELEATVRAMGQRLEELTAANHSYDVPLLADPAGIDDELVAEGGKA